MLKGYVKYYYHALSPNKQKVYMELYHGFVNRSNSIVIHARNYGVTIQEIADIAQNIYYDTPGLYYLDRHQYSYYSLPNGDIVYLQSYLYSEQQVKNYDARLETGILEFQKEYIMDAMSEYEKERAIHDYLVRTVTYDYDALERTDKKTAPVHEASSVMGPLFNGKGICGGISCAFKLLCDYCHIKSFVVLGDVVSNKCEGGHAWNMVKIDGEEYHIDVTWDLRYKGRLSLYYEYYNLDDHLIGVDHMWNRDLYPKCNSVKHNYYHKMHLYVKTCGELSRFIAKYLKKGETFIAVKYANDMPPEREVKKAIQNGFEIASMHGSYRYVISETTHNIYVEKDE